MALIVAALGAKRALNWAGVSAAWGPASSAFRAAALRQPRASVTDIRDAWNVPVAVAVRSRHAEVPAGLARAGVAANQAPRTIADTRERQTRALRPVRMDSSWFAAGTPEPGAKDGGGRRIPSRGRSQT